MTYSEEGAHSVNEEGTRFSYCNAIQLGDALDALSTGWTDTPPSLESDWEEWRRVRNLVDKEQSGWQNSLDALYETASPAIRTAILKGTFFADPYAEITAKGKFEQGFATEEAVLAHYAEEALVAPQACVAYALALMDSNINRRVAFSVVGYVVVEHGWEFVCREVLEGEVALFAQTEVSSRFGCLIELLRHAEDPTTIPSEVLDVLSRHAKNSLEWVQVEAYRASREQVMSLEGIEDSVLYRLPGVEPLRYWDAEKTRELACQLLEQDPIAKASFLRTFNSKNPASEEETQELLEALDPVYAWNVVVEVYNRARETSDEREEDSSAYALSQRVDAVLLSSETVRALARAQVQSEGEAFHYIEEFQYFSLLDVYGAEPHMSTYDVDLHLKGYAEEEGEEDEWVAYATHAFCVPMVQGAFALFNPRGRFLDMVAPVQEATTAQEEENKVPLAVYLRMRSFLEDGRFSFEDKAVATVLSFWGVLPEALRDAIRAHYTAYGLDVDRQQEDVHAFFFEEVVAHSKEFSARVPTDLFEKVSVCVAEAIDVYHERQQATHTLRPETFVGKANAEYGGEGVCVSKARELLGEVRLETVLFLERALGVSLKDFSGREYFALLAFLQEQEKGEGFEKLKTFVGAVEGHEEKCNRIRAFLSLENDVRMGDTLLAIAEENSPETANAVFVSYAGLVRSREDVERYMCETFGCEEGGHRAVVEALLNRCMEKGQQLLLSAKGAVSEDAIARLAHVETDMVLLNESYREMKRVNPSLTLEQCAGVSVETMSTSAVREDAVLCADMERVYRENWEHASPAFAEQKIRLFWEHLAREGRVYFATYEHGGKKHLLSFVLANDVAEGVVFASGLNRNPELEVGDMGRVLLERIIAQESKEHVLTGDIIHGSPLEHVYLEKYGCIATRLHEEGGVLLLDVVLDQVRNAGFVSKSWKNLTEAQTAIQDSTFGDRCVFVQNDDRATLERLFGEGYVLTRLFADGVAVLEKDTTQDGGVKE